MSLLTIANQLKLIIVLIVADLSVGLLIGIFPNCSRFNNDPANEYVEKCIIANYSLPIVNVDQLATGNNSDHLLQFTSFECQQDCNLTSIDGLHLFEHSSQLSELLLNNSGIVHLTASTFANANSLSELDLSYNSIERLADRQFCDAIRLVRIRLSHNQLISMHANTFVCNDRLEELFLDHNRLTAVDAVLPPSIEALYLQSNRISVVSATITNAVQMLDVSNNQLIRFDAAVDNNRNTALVWLNVARNNLTTMHNITSHTMLNELDASFNPIASYHIFTFARLERLVTLRLRRAGLQSFGHGLFGKQWHLRELDVAANELHSVDWTVLAHLPELSELSVEQTGLQDVGRVEWWQPGGLLSALHLSKFCVSGNRFNCTYLMQLMAHLRPDQMCSGEASASSLLLVPNGYASVNGIACEVNADYGSRGQINVSYAERDDVLRQRLDLLDRHLAEFREELMTSIAYRLVAMVVSILLLVMIVLVCWYLCVGVDCGQANRSSGRRSWDMLSESL